MIIDMYGWSVKQQPQQPPSWYQIESDCYGYQTGLHMTPALAQYLCIGFPDRPTAVFAGICTVMRSRWKQTLPSPLCMQPRSIWCLTYYCVCRYLYCDEISLEADTTLPTLYAAKKYMMPHLLLCLQVSVLWWDLTGSRHRPPHSVCRQEVYDASPGACLCGISGEKCWCQQRLSDAGPQSLLWWKGTDVDRTTYDACPSPISMHWISRSTYCCVCRYLYCDEISLEADTTLPTLYAAKKYMMPHLLLCLQVSVLWWDLAGSRHYPPHSVCSQEVYDASPTIVFAGICTVMRSHWKQTPPSPLCMQPRSIWCLTYYCVCRYLYCDEILLETDTVLPTLYAAKKYMIPHLLLCLQVSVLWGDLTGSRHRPPHSVCSQEVYDVSPTIVFAGICTVMRSHWKHTPSSPLCMPPRSIWCLTWCVPVWNIRREMLMPATPVWRWATVASLMKRNWCSTACISLIPRLRRRYSPITSRTLTTKLWNRYWSETLSILRRPCCLQQLHIGPRPSAPIRDVIPVHNSAGTSWVMPCSCWDCPPWHRRNLPTGPVNLGS